MLPSVLIENLEISFQNSDHKLIQGLNVTVRSGELAVVRGKNGSGKSTFLNVLFRVSFRNSMNNKILIKAERFEINGRVGFVFQKPEIQILTFKVKEELATKLSFNRVNIEERKEKVQVISDKYKLYQLLEKDPRSISAGEQQKVIVLANTIGSENIILLDEPLTYLDQDNIELFLNHIQELKNEGYTLIISTHSHYFDKMMDKEILLETSKQKTINTNLENLDQVPNYLISLRIGYFDELAVIDMKLPKTGIFLINGKNGSGKTCLLKTLAGLIPPKEGKIPWESDFAFIPQNPSLTFSKATVKEELGNLPIPPVLQGLVETSPFQLSVGEQKFLATYRAFQLKTICLLDEPFQSLDSEFRNSIVEMMSDHRNDKLIIFSSNRQLKDTGIIIPDTQIINMEENSNAY